MIGFGWMIQYKVNLSGPLILLFVIGFCTSASLNTINVLLVGIFPGRAGSATAANNLVTCWLGAGATSGVVPLIDKVGIGWTTSFLAALNVLFCPILWYIMKNGPQWRRNSTEKKRQQGEKKTARTVVDGEKGKVLGIMFKTDIFCDMLQYPSPVIALQNHLETKTLTDIGPSTHFQVRHSASCSFEYALM